nr:hypothetical protein [Tanacetum cinerariifolium]
TCESAISTALGATATGTGESANDGGLNRRCQLIERYVDGFHDFLSSYVIDSETFLYGCDNRVNQRHKDTISPASCHASADMEFCYSGDGLGNDFGYNKLYGLLRLTEILKLLEISTLFEQLQQETGFVF